MNLLKIISEIRIVKAPQNHLERLLQLKSQLKKGDKNRMHNLTLAIEAARLVLPIFEAQYSDLRPRKAIEAAEAYLNNPTEENMQKARNAGNTVYYAYATISSAIFNVAAAAAAYAAFTAVADAAFTSAYYVEYDAVYAVNQAIRATKEFFKL